MVYDCFQFFNELDLLRIRLNVLNSIVDKFVISEATVTFSGDSKPLYYEENKHLFKEFEHKIIHNVVRDTPNVDPFERDRFQKSAVKRALVNCEDDDVIIFSDLDEIPNPNKVKEVILSLDRNKLYHFAQRNFYCFLNMEEVTGSLLSYTGEFDGIRQKKWLGTKICSYSYLREKTTNQLRFPEEKEGNIRIEQGGWHFSYMGGDQNTDPETRVKYKIQSAAHQEFNNNTVMSSIGMKISRHKDLFGRRAKFKIVPIDETYPDYVRQNIKMFSGFVFEDKKRTRFLGIF